MEFHGAVAAGAENDFLAALAAEMTDDDLIGSIVGQRPAAMGPKAGLHRSERTRPLDPQCGHRSAPGGVSWMT